MREFIVSGMSAQESPSSPGVLSALADDALLGHQRELIARRREIDAALAAVAGEIARRSDRALGLGGLAARLGVRSPEQLVAQETGVSAREAGALVRVGTAAGRDGTGAIVGAAVAAGAVSIAAADEIVRGIGTPSESIGAFELERAVVDLLADTTGRTPESLGEAARDLRAELDAAAVQARERSLREQRSLRLVPLPDGMSRMIALLDPESAAEVRAVLDAITSPRRGGPRFVAASEVDRAERLMRDPRTTEQLALDGFVELLRIGAATAPGENVGTSRPAVRVHVTDGDLRARGLDPATGEPLAADPTTGQRYPVDSISGRPIRPGFAVIEGQGALISVATAERAICATGAVPVHFDFSGQVVNVGRDQRLFTARQRIGLAARDGGCIWPGCDRPPSWCEAHHIDEWRAHGGRTDLADGVLLCRFHHLYVHDRGWRIIRGSGEDSALYQAIPPASHDPSRTPIALPTRRRLRHAHTEESA